MVDDSHAPESWTPAPPENHGVDIAAWPDFEDYDEG
jgi:4a-hydroxytetrahydrobiopterin dehydratase